jgi:hypothetical protein
LKHHDTHREYMSTNSKWKCRGYPSALFIQWCSARAAVRMPQRHVVAKSHDVVLESVETHKCDQYALYVDGGMQVGEVVGVRNWCYDCKY